MKSLFYGIIVGTIVVIAVTGSTIFSSSSIVSTMNFQKKESKETIIDEMAKKLDILIKDLIYKVDNKNLQVTHGINDLQPFPQEVLECEEDCVKQDYSLGTETKRLMREGEDGYLMDWQYTGWTIQDSDYWDIDFSKFSKRSVENQDREYLFKWHINNYKGVGDSGKQRFTFEFRNGDYKYDPEFFDEDTRNGSFVKRKNSTSEIEWLDLGANGSFSCIDGRIQSAFAPMITAGPKALENLIKARGERFHRGDVWTGNEVSFMGLHLWQDAVPKGTYIDVVFENNTTHKQIVVPFVYSDAKNVHWFESAGQRVDQRYGQCRVDIQKSGETGLADEQKVIYTCKVKKIAESETDFMTNFAEKVNVFTVNIYQNLYYYFRNSNINEFYDGQIITNLDNKKDLENKVVLLNDDAVGIFGDWQEISRESVLNYSDSDILNYKAHTALELINVCYPSSFRDTSPKQDGNYYIAQVLLDGFYYEGTPNYETPDWQIVAMRVYKDANSSNYNFTEKSKEMNTVNNIPDTNKVIDFECKPDCKCTMCLKIAR